MQVDLDEIQEGVIMYPTEEEFANFRQYINSLENSPQLVNQGIVKVTLTRSWPQPVTSKQSRLCQKRESKTQRSSNLWSRKFTGPKVTLTRSL